MSLSPPEVPGLGDGLGDGLGLVDGRGLGVAEPSAAFDVFRLSSAACPRVMGRALSMEASPL